MTLMQTGEFMSANYTPGPWICDFFDKPYILNEDQSVYIAEVVVEDDEGRVASRERFEANARLIAAAPDLFEALTLMYNNDASGHRGPCGVLARSCARAALRKAREG
jgi:hypothetical protein